MRPELEKEIERGLPQTLEGLKRLCRQPSISAQKVGIRECAELVKAMLEEAGFSARLLYGPEKDYPVVYAQRRGRNPRTILFYNHYDVQPPEPLELWESPPFEPVVRDGKMYARGVSDDKGHIAARLAAIKALLAVDGELPCNVTFVIEGNEEIGSVGFHQFMEENRELLRADACLWEGGGVNWQGAPEIYLGVKGIVYVELECRTAGVDAHSSYATIVPNAAWRLAWALSTLKDQQERILIPGFYDDVRPPTAQELQAVDALPAEEEERRRNFGIRDFVLGLRGTALNRRHTFEPTCNICGLVAGYTGEGSKTVIPAVARAKIDFRLVPDQRPEDIIAKLKAHLERQGFGDIRVTDLGSEAPARTAMDSPWVRLVRETAEEVYGKKAVVVPNIAGTGPMYAVAHTLKVPVASAGIDYPGNRLHAPNENIRLDLFHQGVLHLAAIVEAYGRGL